MVDDAIVVVENVERLMAMGLSPRDASRKAMDEVTGPVIAIALVLCAVFVPTAFMAGISGEFYKQFALTIAASTVISAFNSLTLSPALAALLLKPHSHGEGEHGQQAVREVLPALGIAIIGGLIAYVFLTRLAAGLVESGQPAPRGVVTGSPPRCGSGRPCSPSAPSSDGSRASPSISCWASSLTASTGSLTWRSRVMGPSSAMLLRTCVIGLVVYGGLMFLTFLGFRAAPTGFIPEQDKGYLVVNAQLPDGASLDRSDQLIRKLSEGRPRDRRCRAHD